MKKCKEYDMLDKQIKAYCGAGCRSLFFRNVLVPDWWRKEMCEDGSLTFSMAYVVAQHLGVSLMPLVNGGDVTIDGGMSAIAYKKRCDDDEEAVDRTSAFMRQLAISTLSGIGEQKDIPCKPEEMRGALLRDYKEVDFLNLLDFCWSLNIPVLSISSQMPHSAHWHRPQAAVFKDKGKYCIFILEKSPFNAKPLFLLVFGLRAYGKEIMCLVDSFHEPLAAIQPDEKLCVVFHMPQAIPGRFKRIEGILLCPACHPIANNIKHVKTLPSCKAPCGGWFAAGKPVLSCRPKDQFNGLVSLARRADDEALVILQDLKPALNISGIISEALRGLQPSVVYQCGGTDFRDKLFL